MWVQLRHALNQASKIEPALAQLKLKTTDYWLPYQQGIRQGRLGVYFVAPHFTSWLTHRHQFTPALKLAGKLQYVIAARQRDSHIFEIRDLANKRVCTRETLNLGFLLVREAMKQSLLPAKVEHVQSVILDMKNNNKTCDAFSLSEHLFVEISNTAPFEYIRLQQSDRYSNYAYVFHPAILPDTKIALENFLNSSSVQTILRPMYRLFAKEPIVLRGEVGDYPRSYLKLLQPYWGQ